MTLGPLRKRSDDGARVRQILHGRPGYDARSPLMCHPPAGADATKVYLSYVRAVEPLSLETQAELAEIYQRTQVPAACDALVLSNLRLVVRIARDLQSERAPLIELIQQGNIGLVEAVSRFDATRGVRFSSYAAYWIRALMFQYLLNETSTVRVGSTRAGRRMFYNLSKVRRKFAEQGIESPSAEQIGEVLGIAPDEVIRVATVMDARDVPLDAKPHGFEGATYAELVACHDPNPEDEAIRSSEVATTEGVFDRFRSSLESARDRAIWDRRLVTHAPETLQDLGDELGVSRERVRQIETRLKDRFRRAWLRSSRELDLDRSTVS